MNETDQLVYDYIVRYKRKNDGIAPSMMEIRNAIDISSSSVVKAILARLQNNNLIELIPGKAGGIKVVGGVWHIGSDRPTYKTKGE